MKLQTELRKTPAQLGQEFFRFLPMLEAQDKVIRETNHDHVAVSLAFPPSLDPKVEHVVKVDVRQERTDTSALYGTHFTRCSLPILQHAGTQPFLDETHDAPVRHTMLDEFHQPSVIEGSKEISDVGVEYPVHVLRTNPDRQRIQRQVRAALGSESGHGGVKVIHLAA